MATRKYNAIFISDFHIGSRGCRAAELLDFLAHNEADRLYLVGDIIDLWMIKDVLRCPQDQADVLRAILTMAGQGTQVYYLLGNHDGNLRRMINGISLGNVHVSERCTHTTADGRKVLVVHGDMYDSFVARWEWFCRLTTKAYHYMTWANELANRLLGKLRMGSLRLSTSVKQRAKTMTIRLANVENRVIEEARATGCDAVICGHIHEPGTAERDGVLYLNAGDWVENCTAVVEHLDGRLELISWSARR